MAKNKGMEYKRKLINALHKANIGKTLNLWSTKTRALEKMVRDNINVIARANGRCPASILAQVPPAPPAQPAYRPKPKKPSRPIDSLAFVKTDAFLQSREWRSLRYEVLANRGARCECCGATAADGIVIQVDHVKPRSKFPELALEISNLQVLCRPCNMGKGARDQTDWRIKSEPKPAVRLIRNGRIVSSNVDDDPHRPPSRLLTWPDRWGSDGRPQSLPFQPHDLRRWRVGNMGFLHIRAEINVKSVSIEVCSKQRSAPT